MRVLVWTESFWPRIGGSEVATSLLLENLRLRGHEFEVVTRQWCPDHPASDDWRGIPVHRVAFDDDSVIHADRRELARLIGRVAGVKRRFRPELIHVGLTGPSLFLHRFTEFPTAVPTIVTLHVEPVETDYGKNKPVHETLRSANTVVAVSSAIARRIQGRLPELAGRCVMIHNALPEPAAAAVPVSLDPPRLVCIGRVTEQKGFETAVAAMPGVRESFPDAELIIAGDGDAAPSLIELARRLNVSDCVRMTGWVPPGDVPALIDGATLVLMPSRWEPFGLVALQAAQRGRACLASSVDGLPEIVVHDRTGLLLPPDDPGLWADAICGLLRDRARVERLGAAAREHVSRRFRVDEHVDAYESLYRRVAGGIREGGATA